MRWTMKARIQRLCAALPAGELLYQQIQRRFGNLNADPWTHLQAHAELVRRLDGLGYSTTDARCVEVGTGHLPVNPIGFYLAGAAEVRTVDLNRRLNVPLTREMVSEVTKSE